MKPHDYHDALLDLALAISRVKNSWYEWKLSYAKMHDARIKLIHAQEYLHNSKDL